MRQPAQSAFSPTPSSDATSSTVIGAAAISGLFVAVLVAASYPFVTMAVGLGAVATLFGRRVYRTVSIIGSRRETDPVEATTTSKVRMRAD